MLLMIRGFLTCVFFGMSVGTIAGCATNRINLVRDGTVTIAVSDCHPITMSAQVERDGEETIVSGIISRTPPMQLGRIHIDVTMTMATGETIKEMTVLAFPRMYMGMRSHKWRFAVWFPFVPPRGSRVHLVCHASPHSEEGVLMKPDVDVKSHR